LHAIEKNLTNEAAFAVALVVTIYRTVLRQPDGQGDERPLLAVMLSFGRADSDLLYHDVIQGDLFTQVERTLNLLLTKYLRAGLSYQGTQRLERLPVPEAALREAVINAIAHKDYGALIPIQISVHEQKLIIWNAGQLPPDWSLARLMGKHPSQPANPDIARALFLAGKIEMTLAEVAVAIQKSPSAVERASAKLVQEGKLKYVGPKKGGYWEVLQ